MQISSLQQTTAFKCCDLYGHQTAPTMLKPTLRYPTRKAVLFTQRELFISGLDRAW